jgi:hypothetical protein
LYFLNTPSASPLPCFTTYSNTMAVEMKTFDSWSHFYQVFAHLKYMYTLCYHGHGEEDILWEWFLLEQSEIELPDMVKEMRLDPWIRLCEEIFTIYWW